MRSDASQYVPEPLEERRMCRPRGNAAQALRPEGRIERGKAILGDPELDVVDGGDCQAQSQEQQRARAAAVLSQKLGSVDALRAPRKMKLEMALLWPGKQAVASQSPGEFVET